MALASTIGFLFGTLVEMLVVLLIVGMVGGLLFEGAAQLRRSVRKSCYGGALLRCAGLAPSSIHSICDETAKGDLVPPKIRELVGDLERAGFVDRSGKGSHRNFVHTKVAKPKGCL